MTISKVLVVSQNIDKQWFMDCLQDQKKSVRGLARYMELDPSAVSRMLSGERRMRMEEAGSIARFLAAPVSEVLAHAGFSVDIDGIPSRIVLAAIITSTGAIERLPDPRPLPQSVIERAHAAIRPHGNGKFIAAQVRASDGPLAVWDDAVFLFGHTENVDHAAIGEMAICRLMSGEQMLAKIERARKTGEAQVLDVSGHSREVILDTATRVLAIIP